jgi:Tfp pilus assembly protein PilF
MRDIVKKIVLIMSALMLAAWLSLPGAAQTSSAREMQEHYQRAQQARAAGDSKTAEREFREILRLDPHSAEAHANLGVIAYTEKTYPQAAEEFRAALKLRPSLWNAKAFLGMCELRLGHADQAKDLLEGSFPHLQDANLQFQAGMDLLSIYSQDRDLTRAMSILEVLERAQPKNPDLLYTTYRTYTELAAHTLATLAQVAPDSAQMHRILAQSQQSQDNFSGAIAEYHKALEVDPNLPGLHYELGQAILANSTDEPSRQEAEKEFRLDLAQDPSNANSHYMLGEIAWMREKPEEALKQYEEAVQLRPDFVDAHIALGKVLTALGRPAEALQHLTESVRLDPQNEVAHYRLAQAYRKLGRNEDAGRESAIFKKLRDSHLAVRALYEQTLGSSVPRQTVGVGESQ